MKKVHNTPPTINGGLGGGGGHSATIDGGRMLVKKKGGIRGERNFQRRNQMGYPERNECGKPGISSGKNRRASDTRRGGAWCAIVLEQGKWVDRCEGPGQTKGEEIRDEWNLPCQSQPPNCHRGGRKIIKEQDTKIGKDGKG